MSEALVQLALCFEPLAVPDYVPLPPPPKAAPAKASPAAAGTPAPAPAAPPPPPKAVQLHAFALKGFHLEAVVRPDCVLEAARLMDKHGYAIDAVTGMDWPVQGLLEVVYDFLHFQSGDRVVFRARIPREQAEIDSIHTIFPGANWHERETHDMFGIRFRGHPDLTPFLLPDDANFHPLLKDFKL